jgi:hypothetical protein
MPEVRRSAAACVIWTEARNRKSVPTEPRQNRKHITAGAPGEKTWRIILSVEHDIKREQSGSHHRGSSEHGKWV